MALGSFGDAASARDASRKLLVPNRIQTLLLRLGLEGLERRAFQREREERIGGTCAQSTGESRRDNLIYALGR